MSEELHSFQKLFQKLFKTLDRFNMSGKQYTFTNKRSVPVSAVQVNHRHRKPGNSVSSRKKEAKLAKKFGTSKPEAFNIKANTSHNIMAKWSYVKKLMDREHRKHHPLINRRVTRDMIEPPILVAVVGPPGVGKSLLIKSLIKHYTATSRLYSMFYQNKYQIV